VRQCGGGGVPGEQRPDAAGGVGLLPGGLEQVCAAGVVPVVDVQGEGFAEGLRERHDAVFAALAVGDPDPDGVQVDVVDSDGDQFGYPDACSILRFTINPVCGWRHVRESRASYERSAYLFKQSSLKVSTTGWTLHQLRHSALTHLAEAGVNLPLLMAKSGHQNLRSLQKYARPAPKPSPP